MKILIILSLAFCCLFSACEILSSSEEEPEVFYNPLKITSVDSVYLQTVSEGFDCNEVYSLTPIGQAQINVYSNEEDLYANQNILYAGTSDSEGFTFFEHSEPLRYFFVQKGELNNYRNLNIATTDCGFLEGSEASLDSILKSTADVIALSQTPSKLQIRVLNNGIPASDALAIIYPTEEDYFNNTLSEEWLPKQPKMGGQHLNAGIQYTKYTDENGIVLFEHLAPEIFWFRVSYEGNSNVNGTFKLVDPLPDDPNVTFGIEVRL